MSHEESRIEAVFLQVQEIQSPQERSAYLEQACGGDEQLRLRVERMLAAQPQLGSFLNRNAAEMVLTIDQPLPERPGTQIGPYKLLQQIGEGGMGVVYLAEQLEPVIRRVALKVIKPGMDTRQVIARFEAERQALSLMDHPNIAKVLDAGTTESGRPYFVMELVKGQPITQYCDDHHLTPRQRLELLLPVCQAVQHAHQKGIIHRDIKPTNILVAEFDHLPVPKVIDFGVAKATSQALTEKTMFTGFGQIVGTLEYMSPEQAKVNQLDIDTRSDIYSLGVLLYELLTGGTPFDKQRLRSAAFDEMLRIIREEEPEKPGTRLSSVGSAHVQSAQGWEVGTAHPTLASIAAVRSTEPAKLTKLVRGELDWIVMKALEKDRSRRYETANGLAMDIQRYLHDEPVQACPPSAAYRLRKFTRRNRAALATALMIAGALLLGLLGTTWQAIRATRAEGIAQKRFEAEHVALRDTERARQAAEKDRVNALRQEAIAVAEAAKAKSTLKLLREMLSTGGNRAKEYTVRQMLDDFSGKLDQLSLGDAATEAEIQEVIGRTYRNFSCWKEAESHLRRAIALQQASGDGHSRIAENLGICAWWIYAPGLHSAAPDRAVYEEDGEAMAREAIALCGTSDEDLRIHLNALRTIQHFKWLSGKHEEADLVAREALAIAGDREIPILSSILHDLADSTTSRGRYAEGEAIARRALDFNRRTSSGVLAAAWAQVTLARALVMQGKDDEGIARARGTGNLPNVSTRFALQRSGRT
jgi:eukaryotic-like serine/threonine-protein kinase